jgi:hypothetical protein
MTISYKLFRKYHLNAYALFLTANKYILMSNDFYEEGVPGIKHYDNHMHLITLKDKTFLMDLKENKCFTNFIGEMHFE